MCGDMLGVGKQTVFPVDIYYNMLIKSHFYDTPYIVSMFEDSL